MSSVLIATRVKGPLNLFIIFWLLYHVDFVVTSYISYYFTKKNFLIHSCFLERKSTISPHLAGTPTSLLCAAFFGKGKKWSFPNFNLRMDWFGGCLCFVKERSCSQLYPNTKTAVI